MPRGTKGSGKSTKSNHDAGKARGSNRNRRSGKRSDGPAVTRDAGELPPVVTGVAQSAEPAPGAEESDHGEIAHQAQDSADPTPSGRKRGRPKDDQPAPPAELSREALPAMRPGPESPPESQHDPVLQAAEQQLMEKYPLANIKTGSLRPGASEGWGSKRIVTILCGACNAERTVATSDLFHVRHCRDCAKGGQPTKKAREGS
ncbi:MAG: hypothetical protein JWO38_7171 [Gemmataceae bacterium]|nr:hypothetical protein [Gemmataceae bacterium]